MDWAAVWDTWVQMTASVGGWGSGQSESKEALGTCVNPCLTYGCKLIYLELNTPFMLMASMFEYNLLMERKEELWSHMAHASVSSPVKWGDSTSFVSQAC
jgi:hypothetical protein